MFIYLNDFCIFFSLHQYFPSPSGIVMLDNNGTLLAGFDPDFDNKYLTLDLRASRNSRKDSKRFQGKELSLLRNGNNTPKSQSELSLVNNHDTNTLGMQPPHMEGNWCYRNY